jgi:hypothetical protein
MLTMADLELTNPHSAAASNRNNLLKFVFTGKALELL